MAKRPKRSGSTSGGSKNPMKGLEKLTEKLISTTTQELTKVQDAIQNTANAASSSLGSPSPSPTASKSGLLDKAMLVLSFKKHWKPTEIILLRTHWKFNRVKMHINKRGDVLTKRDI